MKTFLRFFGIEMTYKEILIAGVCWALVLALFMLYVLFIY